MTVNVMLSIERQIDAMVNKSQFAQSSPEYAVSYQLGVCESMLAQALHQIYDSLGEDAMIDVMKKININPVFSS